LRANRLAAADLQFAIPIHDTALWRWPFAARVDYLACATVTKTAPDAGRRGPRRTLVSSTADRRQPSSTFTAWRERSLGRHGRYRAYPNERQGLRGAGGVGMMEG
jgi:hypothetical protein